MNYPRNRLTRALFVILVLMGGVFSLVSPAQAQGISVTFEDSIPAGQVVDNDVILAGTTVNIDGTVEGDALAVGAFVEVNGEVAGSLVAVGQNVTINGAVQGTVYVAAVQLELGEEAELSRNLYYLGASLNTAKGSTIGRDLALVSMGAQLSGDIGRNTVGIIGPWELFKLFMDLIGRPVFEPQTGIDTPYRVQSERVVFAGFLPSLSSTVLIGSEAPSYTESKLIPASITQPDLSGQAGSSVDSEKVTKWLRWGVEEFITLLVFGLIGIWLFATFLKRSAQKLETKPLQSTGIGLLGLVISAALIGVVLLVAVMILMIGIGLASLSLWDLAWAVWGVGFTSLSLAFWLSLLFVSYGTKVIVAFLVGTLILKRLAPNSLQYKILPLLLGILIYVLLAWIPYFGWVIAVLVNAIGLGAAWFAFRDRGVEELEEETKTEKSKSK